MISNKYGNFFRKFFSVYLLLLKYYILDYDIKKA